MARLLKAAVHADLNHGQVGVLEEVACSFDPEIDKVPMRWFAHGGAKRAREVRRTQPA